MLFSQDIFIKLFNINEMWLKKEEEEYGLFFDVLVNFQARFKYRYIFRIGFL